MSNDQRYPDFKHEDELINQRLTWLLQSQALLFAGFGLVVTTDKLPVATAESLAKIFIQVGVFSAVIITIGIIAAIIASCHIWSDTSEEAGGRHVPFGVRWWTTALGFLTALLLPAVFIFGWAKVADQDFKNYKAPTESKADPSQPQKS